MKTGKFFTYRRMKLIFGILLSVIFFGAALCAVIYGFEVKDIEFVGDTMTIEFNERLVSGNILFFPSDKIKHELLSQYPQLKDVVIRKKFPHTILIEPILRTPYAVLVTTNALYGIDEDGNVVGIESSAQNLPELHMDLTSVHVGSSLKDEKVQSSLSFLKKIKPFLSVSSINTNGDGSTLIAISDITQILFTQTQNIDTLISTLQTIITGVRIKGTMPKIIDVRYSKPVIQW